MLLKVLKKSQSLHCTIYSSFVASKIGGGGGGLTKNGVAICVSSVSMESGIIKLGSNFCLVFYVYFCAKA